LLDVHVAEAPDTGPSLLSAVAVNDAVTPISARLSESGATINSITFDAEVPSVDEPPHPTTNAQKTIVAMINPLRRTARIVASSELSEIGA
jgi:hypothetical protein